MTFEGRWCDPASRQRGLQVRAAMQALTAGCNFKAVEKQIEAGRSCRRARMRVERTT